MTQLSKHFKRKEFKCKCGKCDHDSVDAELLMLLEDVREHFGAPVTVNSGHRCEKHNASQGGASKSKHLIARAADIKVKGKSPKEVIHHLVMKYPDKYGFIEYSSFVHVDSREEKYHKFL